MYQDVINYNCRALVASVPFFTNADPSFVSEVVTKLQYEVFQPGPTNRWGSIWFISPIYRWYHYQGGDNRDQDVLHPRGDCGHSDAERGCGHITQRWIILWRDLPPNKRKEGCKVKYFFRSSFIHQFPTLSVRAETYCNLFSLSVDHFNAVLASYPLMRRTMESIAAERWVILVVIFASKIN